MSEYMRDISSLYAPNNNTIIQSTNTNAGSNSLDFSDYLKLIVAQFQYQDPNNAADTSEMLNLLVQMSLIQSVSDMTDATVMSYTASLVGKEVTIGEYDSTGKLQETVGTVTATGTYNGSPVVFVDGVSYSLSSIMAVGRLDSQESNNVASQ